MSIVTFWNDDKEQTGKTLTAVAVATKMAIDRNLKILLISTSYKDDTLRNCFWVDTIQKNTKIFGNKNNNIGVQSGIEGLSKLITSNKIQPSIITDYTKVIFKGRLEILNGYVGSTENTEEENVKDYKKVVETYPELLAYANQYYDMVLIDIDKNLEPQLIKKILELAHLNIMVTTQRVSSLNRYSKMKDEDKTLIGPRNMTVIGKYNPKSKYNRKNIIREYGEKKDLHVVPFNTLYFEATEEIGVTEMFLRLRKIKDTEDTNYFFMSEVKKLSDDIITRLQELQMRMR